MIKIEFCKNGYDPQIDYIKGLCILFVVLTHCMSREELGRILFPYWGDTAVPIFLIIQVFHYYKNGINLRMPNILKLCKRIIIPFVMMTVTMFAIQYFIYYNTTGGFFSPSLYWDKRGPGSYYILIYLEFAFIIPFFAPLLHKISRKWLLVFFVIISQLFEYLCCIIQCPDYIYRITFFRYLFLIFIGYILVTKGLVVTKHTICGIIISVFFLYLFNYTNIDMEPIYYTSISNWKCCHWICYIYIAYFFLWFLKYTHKKLSKYKKIQEFFVSMGRFSYEIYLFQIIYYATISIYVSKALSSVEYYPIRHILYIVISTIICLLPAILKCRNKLFGK